MADDEEIDSRTSMLPPSNMSSVSSVIPKAPNAPKIQMVAGDGPYAVAIRAPTPDARAANDPTSKLADMEGELAIEILALVTSVRKSGRYGSRPLGAVELVQQIG